MHTTYIDGHQLSLETDTYLTVAASVAADQQEAAVAMLRDILRSGAMDIADLWSQFTHAAHKAGPAFETRANNGDTEPYLALLLDYSLALTLDQRGFSFVFRSRERNYLTAAEEEVLVNNLAAWGVRGHVVRGVTSGFPPHTEAVLEAIALSNSLVPGDDLEDWFGTPEAVLLLTAHHRDSPDLNIVTHRVPVGVRS